MRSSILQQVLQFVLPIKTPCCSKLYLLKNRWVLGYAQEDAGYSLIEFIAVILVLGILAGIAFPGWVAFNNRRQLNQANDSVLAAIRQAQGEAKAKKRSYSVSFKTASSIPQIAVYPDSTTISDNQWQPLGSDLGLKLKAGQILVSTNLGNTNQGGSGTLSSLTDTATKTITFDYTGNLPVNANPPIKVVVATPQSGVKRCVIIQTLIGGTQTGKDNQCS